MMRTLPYVFILSAVLFIQGCQTQEITKLSDLPEDLNQVAVASSFDASARIPKSGTFCWRYGSGPIEDDADAMQYNPSLRILIAQAMKERRYDNVAPGNATLEVAYAYTLDTPLNEALLNQHFNYAAQASKKNPYREGTLFIHIFDHATGKRIWQGSAYAKVALDEKLSEEVRRQRLLRIIRSLLKEFFPKPYI